jgi:uncharacterized protein DUF4402
MRQTRSQGTFKTWAVGAVAALLIAAPSTLVAASATALVSATVLGPAETEIASGAVTVSKISQSDQIEVAGSGHSEARRDARNLSTYRVGGGFHASYAVTLPETVMVKSAGAEIAVSGFRATGGAGRLASDGTGTFGVSASVAIPAGQAPGTYTGSYPVTISYN